MPSNHSGDPLVACSKENFVTQLFAFFYYDSGVSSYRQFKTREQFHSVDEYSRYVKENIAIGMNVQCCETYEEIRKGDAGRVTKVKRIGTVITLPELTKHCLYCTSFNHIKFHLMKT